MPLECLIMWLDLEVQRPEIDFGLPPNSGHLVVHAGLPFVTRRRHWRCRTRSNTGRSNECVPNSPLKKAPLTGFHAMAKHTAAKAVSPFSETMRTI